MGRIAKNLKILIDKRKLSQRELARQLECSHISVNEWVRGVKEPRTEMRKKIASHFGIDEHQLFQEPEIPAVLNIYDALNGMSLLNTYSVTATVVRFCCTEGNLYLSVPSILRTIVVFPAPVSPRR